MKHDRMVQTLKSNKILIKPGWKAGFEQEFKTYYTEILKVINYCQARIIHVLY